MRSNIECLMNKQRRNENQEEGEAEILYMPIRMSPAEEDERKES